MELHAIWIKSAADPALRPYGDLRQGLGESVSCLAAVNLARSSRLRPLNW